MTDEIKTAGLDAVKMNVSKGLSYIDAQYDNFIDIAAHVAVKALVDKFKHAIVSTEDVRKEFSTLKEWYDIFSQAYIGERKVLAKAVSNSHKANIELTYLANAKTKDEALKYAIEALRHITDDDYIGEKWTSQ